MAREKKTFKISNNLKTSWAKNLKLYTPMGSGKDLKPSVAIDVYRTDALKTKIDSLSPNGGAGYIQKKERGMVLGVNSGQYKIGDSTYDFEDIPMAWLKMENPEETIENAEALGMLQALNFIRFYYTNPQHAFSKQFATIIKESSLTELKGKVDAFFAGIKVYQNAKLHHWRQMSNWIRLNITPWQGKYYVYDSDASKEKGALTHLGVINITKDSADFNTNGSDQKIPLIMDIGHIKEDESTPQPVTFDLQPAWISQNINGRYKTVAVLSGTMSGKKVFATVKNIDYTPDDSKSKMKEAESEHGFLGMKTGELIALGMLLFQMKDSMAASKERREKRKEKRKEKKEKREKEKKEQEERERKEQEKQEQERQEREAQQERERQEREAQQERERQEREAAGGETPEEREAREAQEREEREAREAQEAQEAQERERQEQERQAQEQAEREQRQQEEEEDNQEQQEDEQEEQQENQEVENLNNDIAEHEGDVQQVVEAEQAYNDDMREAARERVNEVRDNRERRLDALEDAVGGEDERLDQLEDNFSEFKDIVENGTLEQAEEFLNRNFPDEEGQDRTNNQMWEDFERQILEDNIPEDTQALQEEARERMADAEAERNRMQEAEERRRANERAAEDINRDDFKPEESGVEEVETTVEI